MRTIIILFSIYVLCNCNLTDNPEEYSCFDQHRKQQTQPCIMGTKEKIDELNESFKRAVYKNPSTTSVLSWTKKFCEFGKNSIDCFNGIINATLPECRQYGFNKENVLTFGLIYATYNYVCDNGGKRLIEFIENGGCHCIFYNQRFDKCNEIHRMQRVESFELNFYEQKKYCQSFDKIKECFVQKARECPNQNISMMINDAFINAKTSMLCDG